MEGKLMLRITRRPGASVLVDIAADIAPSAPVDKLFDHPIELRILSKLGWKIHAGIEATQGLHIYGDELSLEDDAPDIVPSRRSR